MPNARSKKRMRNMKGGWFFDSSYNGTSSSDNGSSSWFNPSSLFKSVTSSVTNAYNNAKNALGTSSYGSANTTSLYTPTTSTYTPTTSTYTPTTTSTGGRKRRKTRRMRGGNFTDNIPTTGLAAGASPISGIPTAQPHNWVGGRTRRHRNRRSKSRRTR